MLVRSMRNFTFNGDSIMRGDVFEVDDRMADKLKRTRYVQDAGASDADVGVASLDTGALGMLRRETRTTAPIPNPPAGPEPLRGLVESGAWFIPCALDARSRCRR